MTKQCKTNPLIWPSSFSSPVPSHCQALLKVEPWPAGSRYVDSGSLRRNMHFTAPQLRGYRAPAISGGLTAHHLCLQVLRILYGVIRAGYSFRCAWSDIVVFALHARPFMHNPPHGICQSPLITLDVVRLVQIHTGYDR